MSSSEAVAEWRRHWKVVAGSAVGFACGIAVWPLVMSSFVEPLQQAYGWSRSEIALALNAGIVSGLLAPVAGRLTDRWGVRPMATAGMALTGLGYILLANVHGSLALYYLFYLFLNIVGIGTSSLTFTRAITSWFSASRGLALSLSRPLQALFGAFLPLVILWAMNRFGWQGGFYTLALLALFVGVPAAWFLVTERPDGPGTQAGVGRTASARPESWLSLLGNRRLQLLCLALGLFLGVAIGVLSQLHPILTSGGIPDATAASLRGAYAVALLGGTLASGVLVDRLHAPRLAFVAMLAAVLGCLALANSQLGVVVGGLAIALLGIAYGASANLTPYLIARYFGLGSYSTIYGITILAMAAASAVGGALFGVAFDAFGNYRLALLGGALCCAVAAVTYLFLGPYPDTKSETSKEAPASLGPEGGSSVIVQANTTMGVERPHD